VIAPQQDVDHVATRSDRLAHSEQRLLDAENPLENVARSSTRTRGREHILFNTLGPLGNRVYSREIAIDHGVDQPVHQIRDAQSPPAGGDHRPQFFVPYARDQVFDLWERVAMNADQIVGAPEELQLACRYAVRARM